MKRKFFGAVCAAGVIAAVFFAVGCDSSSGGSGGSHIAVPDYLLVEGTTIVGCVKDRLPAELKIPEGITGILGFAFTGCTGLKNLTIPVSVVTIHDAAFDNCPNLATVVYTGTLAQWCYIFQDWNLLCHANTVRLEGSNIENLKEMEHIEIPSGVTQINDGAFRYLENLKSVTIPNTVESIGFCAFESCTGIEEIVIPDSVYSIGALAFGKYYPNDEKDMSLKKVTIGKNVKTIGVGAFRVLKNLEEVIIPSDSVTEIICRSAFSNCSSLASIEIPKSVTRIEEGAFANCISLEEVIIPSGSVTEIICEAAFFGCTSLASIEIPKNVTRIEEMAFVNCISLEEVKFADTENWYQVYFDTPIDVSDPGVNASELNTSTFTISFSGGEEWISAASWGYTGGICKKDNGV